MSDLKNRDTHPHTIEAIAAQTRLTPNYVRRIINSLPALSKEYGHKETAEKNRLYFDNNGFSAFKTAARLKGENKSLNQIVSHLRAGLPPEPEQTPDRLPEKQADKDLQNTAPHEPENIPYLLYKDLKESYKDRFEKQEEQFNERLLEKDRTIETLNNSMKFLTDGKTPEDRERAAEEKRQKHREEVERVERALSEAKAAEQKQREQLQDEREAKEGVEQTLKNTQQERDAAQQQAEQLAKTLEAHRSERKGLLNRLQELEGKWFAGKERKEILARLCELDAEIEKLLGNQDAGDLKLEVKPE